MHRGRLLHRALRVTELTILLATLILLVLIRDWSANRESVLRSETGIWRRVRRDAFGRCDGMRLLPGKTDCFTRAPRQGFGPMSFFNHAAYAVDKGMFLSLPSGDVAIVAGAAVSLSFSLNSRRLLFFLLLVPFMTAFSRVSLNRHWPSDTAVEVINQAVNGTCRCQARH